MKTTIATSMLIPATLLMLAADKGGTVATAPGESSKPQSEAKTKPEAKVHPALETKIKAYDSACQQAETYYIEIVEIIQSEKISRADVVQTLMRARGITFETAQSQYSRMKNIWQNETVLQELKQGIITLAVARQRTTKPQAGTEAAKAAAGTGKTGGDATKTAETKELRYERTLKAFIASCKECGFDKKSVLTSVDANLKAAGIV